MVAFRHASGDLMTSTFLNLFQSIAHKVKYIHDTMHGGNRLRLFCRLNDFLE